MSSYVERRRDYFLSLLEGIKNDIVYYRKERDERYKKNPPKELAFVLERCDERMQFLLDAIKALDSIESSIPLAYQMAVQRIIDSETGKAVNDRNMRNDEANE